jgi:ABC-type spermidine/putrescine transport system permease subunit II
MSFLLGIPVAYLLNRVTRKLERVEFMVVVAVITTAIVLAVDILAVLVLSGTSYLQDINWLLTAQLAVQDFLACLVIGGIMWKEPGKPGDKKVYVS